MPQNCIETYSENLLSFKFHFILHFALFYSLFVIICTYVGLLLRVSRNKYMRANETGRYGTTPHLCPSFVPRKTFVSPRMMMMMMGMNTFARRKHNFPDRRKGNVIIRPDTKRSSAKITRPVINILEHGLLSERRLEHLWRAPVAHRIHAETPFREPKRRQNTVSLDIRTMKRSSTISSRS